MGTRKRTRPDQWLAVLHCPTLGWEYERRISCEGKPPEEIRVPHTIKFDHGVKYAVFKRRHIAEWLEFSHTHAMPVVRYDYARVVTEPWLGQLEERETDASKPQA